eukprot:scaffold120787_cov21-Tisochrysis_lutea.AAC.1
MVKFREKRQERAYPAVKWSWDVSFPGSEDMVYTPLLRRSSVHYYTLTLNEITVGNKPVEVPSTCGLFVTKSLCACTSTCVVNPLCKGLIAYTKKLIFCDYFTVTPYIYQYLRQWASFRHTKLQERGCFEARHCNARSAELEVLWSAPKAMLASGRAGIVFQTCVGAFSIPPHLESTYAKGYGCVLDSGTTFLYLPSAAFSSFSKLVKDAAQNNKLPSRDGPDPR